MNNDKTKEKRVHGHLYRVCDQAMRGEVTREIRKIAGESNERGKVGSFEDAVRYAFANRDAGHWLEVNYHLNLDGGDA